MAPLFSKFDSNKLWRDVQSEKNVICAKFGKDVFNISKVIGRKKWPSFFGLTVYIVCTYHKQLLNSVLSENFMLHQSRFQGFGHHQVI